jgi:hypothetical protein
VTRKYVRDASAPRSSDSRSCRDRRRGTAAADPLNPVPGNGFFLVGPDIAPGLYNTGGTASTWGVWINDVPTQDSMCVWFTYSTPDANKDNVVDTNMSIGPMFANINSTVMAFESRNCQPWTRVP